MQNFTTLCTKSSGISDEENQKNMGMFPTETLAFKFDSAPSSPSQAKKKQLHCHITVKYWHNIKLRVVGRRNINEMKI